MICPICGRDFDATPHHKTYCSRACMLEARRRRAREYYTANAETIKKQCADYRKTKAAPGTGVCPICGAKIARRRAKYCSRACYNAARANSRVCPVCGKSFICSPSGTQVCCSDECSKILRSQKLTGNADNDAMLKNVRDAFFATHQGEKHQSAKGWVIKSPTGETYEITNLRYWVRENTALLGVAADDWLRAYRGIVNVKRSLAGTRKRNLCPTGMVGRLRTGHNKKDSR